MSNTLMAYAWKQGARISIPAAVVGVELERIRQEQDGFLTPSCVVSAAEPIDAPLHPAFEWDDKKAASAHREDQARYLIRSIVVIKADEPDPEPVRAFVSVRGDQDQPRYTAFDHAMSDDDMREQVLSNALRDMQAFERKYSKIAELAGVLKAISKARDNVQAALAKRQN